MSLSGHCLPLAVATIAMSPIWLAGCAASGVDRPVSATAPLPGRTKPVGLAIAQLRFGNGAPFEVCLVDACPAPTPKTLGATAALNSAALAVPAELAATTAPSLKHEAVLIPAEAGKPPAGPALETAVITFASGRATLTAAARKALGALAFQARAAERIEVRGRTDESGDAQLNDVLARKRALAVRDYFHQELLAEPSVIHVSSKGACCYVAGNGTEEGRAANRRVEIEFKRASFETRSRE